MHIKKLVILVFAALFFLTGCNKVTKDKNDQAESKSPISVDYANLSDSEKSEMTFEFFRSSDSHRVDLKVINRTSKQVNFSGNKFELISPQRTTIDSNHDNISLDSNSTKTFKDLFSGVDPTTFERIGLYCYKNTANKLAYSLSDLSVAKSTNLKDTNVQASFKNFGKKVNNHPTKKKTNLKPVTNVQQAIALVKKQNGPAPKGMLYDYMRDATSSSDNTVRTGDDQVVYWVRLFESDGHVTIAKKDWTVFLDGRVLPVKPSSIGNPQDPKQSDTVPAKEPSQTNDSSTRTNSNPN